MHVQIVKVLGETGLVQVATAAGMFQATWRGNSEPVEGHEDDVELDLERAPTWGVDLYVADDPHRLDGAAPTMAGKIEDYSDVMTLRIGGEGLLLVAAEGTAPARAVVGVTVLLVEPSLALWPTNL